MIPSVPSAVPAGTPSGPVGRSLDRDVTSAQRARLVVALGVLNLVLASLAFAVGIGAPAYPTRASPPSPRRRHRVTRHRHPARQRHAQASEAPVAPGRRSR